MATSSPAKSSTDSSSESVPKSGSTTQGGQESSRTTENRYQEEDSLTEDFIGNPTRDTLAEGLIGLLTPSIENLDQGITGHSDSFDDFLLFSKFASAACRTGKIRQMKKLSTYLRMLEICIRLEKNSSIPAAV